MDPTTWNAPFAVTVAALSVIVFFRSNATYWIGRAIAAGSRKTRLVSWLDSAGYLRAQRWLAQWGAPAITMSYLTIGVQTMVHLAAGVGKMPLRHYLPAAVLGSIVWGIIYAVVGFVGIEAAARLWERNPSVAVVVIALLLLGATTALIVKIRRAHS